MSFKKLLWLCVEFLLPQTSRARFVETISYEKLMSLYKPEMVQGDCVALFPYRNELIRNLLLELKYYKNQHAAELFGKALEDYLVEPMAEEKLFGNAPVLIPIPRSHNALRKRGFNQVELVAEHLLDKMPDLVYRPDLLTRVRSVESQTSQPNRAARAQNVKGVFATQKIPTMKNKVVILLDDVITTGSTMREASRVFEEEGVAISYRIALAH